MNTHMFERIYTHTWTCMHIDTYICIHIVLMLVCWSTYM